MLCYAMLCYAMLCYAMLCYIYIYIYICSIITISLIASLQGAPRRHRSDPVGFRNFNAQDLNSGGWKCALVGVPWQGSASARLAWVDIVSFNMLSKVLNMLSILRRQGTPMRAHLQKHDNDFWGHHEITYDKL